MTPAAVKKKVMVIAPGLPAWSVRLPRRSAATTSPCSTRRTALAGISMPTRSTILRVPTTCCRSSHTTRRFPELGIEVRLNTEVHAKFMRSVLHQYDVCVIAAGATLDRSRYAHMKGAERMLDGLDVAHGRCKTGRRVVIVGGGKLGLTLAESLRKHQEAEVTVVELGKRIAGDVKPSFKWRHATWVEELGITCLTSSSLIEVTADSVKVRNAKGEEVYIAADTVVQADGATRRIPCFTNSSG